MSCCVVVFHVGSTVCFECDFSLLRAAAGHVRIHIGSQTMYMVTFCHAFELSHAHASETRIHMIYVYVCPRSFVVLLFGIRLGVFHSCTSVRPSTDVVSNLMGAHDLKYVTGGVEGFNDGEIYVVDCVF